MGKQSQNCGGICIFNDCTEKRQLQKEIMEISQREKQRIGQDLHDSIGQLLTGITFLAKAAEIKLHRTAGMSVEEIMEISRIAKRATTYTRNLSRGLSPLSIGEKNSMMDALLNFAESVEKVFDINCTPLLDERINDLDEFRATQIYYIVQEAVNNAVKHGGAENIIVEAKIMSRRKSLIVRIVDDGKGMLMQGCAGNGMGLKIMKYRSELMGAIFQINTKEKGLEISVEVNNFM